MAIIKMELTDQEALVITQAILDSLLPTRTFLINLQRGRPTEQALLSIQEDLSQPSKLHSLQVE